MADEGLLKPSMKGRAVYMHVHGLNASGSILRRKVPALRLMATDSKRFAELEAEAKLKFDLAEGAGADNMLMGVHLQKVVEANKAFQTESLAETNTVKLSNPKFFGKFVSLFGIAADKQVLKKFKEEAKAADAGDAESEQADI